MPRYGDAIRRASDPLAHLVVDETWPVGLVRRKLHEAIVYYALDGYRFVSHSMIPDSPNSYARVIMVFEKRADD